MPGGRSIFISYAQTDELYAKLIAEKLQKLTQADILLSSKEKNVGELFPSLTEKQLRAADAFVVIMSPASYESSWVRAEVAIALSQAEPTIPIFPVLRGPEECIPILLRNHHYIDMGDDASIDANVTTLARHILLNFQNASELKNFSNKQVILQLEKLKAEEDILSEKMRKAKADYEKKYNSLIKSLGLASLAVTASAIGVVGQFSIHGLPLEILAAVIPALSAIAGFFFGVTNSGANSRSSNDDGVAK